MTGHLMLSPSLACPARCLYCFGPHGGNDAMQLDTLEAVVNWQKSLAGDESLEITFHGGEPLLPGISFYRLALPLLREGLAPRSVQFSIQSNLWLLTDELCDLFARYDVSLGTSLDGPEAITDAQRGEGYFRQTMAGIERAKSHGLHVGCICTFTAQSAPQASSVFDFFAREKLNISIHAALPSLTYPAARAWSIDAEVYGQLLVDALDWYLYSLGAIRIHTLDALCRSTSSREGGICLFGNCLGRHLAVAPRGEIYPCQRFAGQPDYCIGNVHDADAPKTMKCSRAWQLLQWRQSKVEEECRGCPDFDICQGGCPYHVLAHYGSFDRSLRDPHCVAFRRMFATLVNKVLDEVFAQDNMQAVADCPDAGLFQVGRLVSLL